MSSVALLQQATELLMRLLPARFCPADMVHTQYHLRVAAHHLEGALERMGAMLASPLLLADCATREVSA